MIASHAACRFGERMYNLEQATIERIAARGGVIGLILSDHWIQDGLPRPRASAKAFDHAFSLLCTHIDRIREITGTYRHIAIGSDLDRFVKPTLAGLEHSGRLPLLAQALANRYGSDTAALIGSENALRLLRTHWRPAMRGPTGR